MATLLPPTSRLRWVTSQVRPLSRLWCPPAPPACRCRGAAPAANNFPITVYNLRHQTPPSGPWITAVSVIAPTLTSTITVPAAGTYNVQVQAANSAGVGALVCQCLRDVDARGGPGGAPDADDHGFHATQGRGHRDPDHFAGGHRRPCAARLQSEPSAAARGTDLYTSTHRRLYDSRDARRGYGGGDERHLPGDRQFRPSPSALPSP